MHYTGCMQPYWQFVRDHARDDRATFLNQAAPRYLLLPEIVEDGDAPLPVLTMRASPEDRARQLLAGVVIAPLEKTPGLNAFSHMVTLGRAPNNDLVLPHPAVSKFHLFFRIGADGAWAVCDANSSNGTTLDDARLPSEQATPLRSGARLTLGEVIEVEVLSAEDLWGRIQGELHCLATSSGPKPDWLFGA